MTFFPGIDGQNDMTNLEKLIAEGGAVLGIELGSTRRTAKFWQPAPTVGKTVLKTGSGPTT